MKRALAILVIALSLYACADALRAADVRVARISRTETLPAYRKDDTL